MAAVLDLRPNCELCDRDLPPESTEAMICTFECTFCRRCVADTLQNVFPNCGGGLVTRPIRPSALTLPLARRVGPAGHVFALDPEPAALDVLRRRLAKARVRNVTPVLNDDREPMLPDRACDLAVIVNVYHHFAEPAAFLKRMARCLKPGGRLVNIDWADRDTPKGPPAHRRIPPAVFLRHARRAGLVLVKEHAFLPYQYFVVLRRAR
jgi:uncharacterized protein